MFGRRRKRARDAEWVDGDEATTDRGDLEPEDTDDAAAPAGPYDAEDAPDDGRPRLDLGALRLPVPDGAQLQVEVAGQSGPVRAVHLMTGLGQITVTAFAAPRSGGLWKEVARELVARLRADGARVGRVAGEWGEELDALTPQGMLRFLGVDGPRWMLRGVAVGSPEQVEERAALLRDVVRETVVVRGAEPLPVRSQLPLELPPSLVAQLHRAAAPAPATGSGGTGTAEPQ